jgi:hypothetical protein
MSAQMITPVIFIRKVTSSNFGQDTNYLTEGFHSFSKSLEANVGIVLYIRPRPLPSISLTIHYHLSFDVM